jgi:hypothetical protein
VTERTQRRRLLVERCDVAPNAGVAAATATLRNPDEALHGGIEPTDTFDPEAGSFMGK